MTCVVSNMCVGYRDWPGRTLKRLFHIDGLLGTGLEVRDIPLGLAERHGSFRRDHPLILLRINLVANHNLGA